LLVLPGSGIAFAVDETTGPGWAETQRQEKAQARTSRAPGDAAMLKAFTRELAFIKTFSVDSPSQYDQAGAVSGTGAVQDPVFDSAINTPPVKTAALEEAVKQVEARQPVKKKKTGGRKK
jgi:hypothetical protein